MVRILLRHLMAAVVTLMLLLTIDSVFGQNPSTFLLFTRDAEAKVPIEPCDYAVYYHFTIQYEYEDSMRTAIDTLVLEMGKTCNRFSSVTADWADSVNFYYQRDGGKRDFGDHFILYMDVYTYLQAQEWRVYHLFAKNTYYYVQDIVPMQWETLPGDTTVMGLTCRKAKTEYGGRTWYAWYTVDIPMNYGPWKLGNLPGLILKAEDADAIFTWEAISMEEPKNRTIYRYDGSNYEKTLSNEGDRYQERRISRKQMDKLWKRRWQDILLMITLDSRGMISFQGPASEYKILDTFYPQFETDLKNK